jgi:ADP-ribosyl-[dinitrogen reductase] hydrolase
MAEHTITERIEGALWGLFVADALAMPIHWYYNRENIYKDFPLGVSGFEAPPFPHPEAFMIGMSYRPNVEMAKKLGRNYDILHKHAGFYNTSYSSMNFSLADNEKSHGNSVASKDQRYHYHHGLEAGENTLGAELVRVMLRQIIDSGSYDPYIFILDFIRFMTTPGVNHDPYTEIYIRRWFENYPEGMDPMNAAEQQRNVWSIGSHGGMIRPMVLSLLFAGDRVSALGAALNHQIITHRSEIVSGALTVSVPLLTDLINGSDLQNAVQVHGRNILLPEITGEKLFARYREYKGPGNIPRNEMWHIHMDRSEKHFDPKELQKEVGDENVIMGTFATACYPEHGLPLALYHAWRHNTWDALLTDVNAGGDNVHRGMILGLILGASNPEIMKQKAEALKNYLEIKKEISAFAQLSGKNSVY